jgi:serine/threonine protein kinase
MSEGQKNEAGAMPEHPAAPDPYATSDKPAIPPAGISTATYLPDEGSGTMVGPYKLLQPLGKGGMGVVWMAEQREPVERYVAIKIIKADLRGDQVLARFEAERQALAMMDHPNIAKVLDAGATAAGRPYFVMELVKGVPFSKYCDHEKLPLKERLDLFISVCNAVQHAHQKASFIAT